MNSLLFLKPRLSEKTYAQADRKNRVYVFDVEYGANKQTIKGAVEKQFEVKVENVRVLNLKGKAKRTISASGRRSVPGVNSDLKKAYVTLAEGQSLPFFAAIEEAEEKQAKTQEQVEKQAAKQAKKQAKSQGKDKA